MGYDSYISPPNPVLKRTFLCRSKVPPISFSPSPPYEKGKGKTETQTKYANSYPTNHPSPSTTLGHRSTPFSNLLFLASPPDCGERYQEEVISPAFGAFFAATQSYRTQLRPQFNSKTETDTGSALNVPSFPQDSSPKASASVIPPSVSTSPAVSPTTVQGLTRAEANRVTVNDGSRNGFHPGH